MSLRRGLTVTAALALLGSLASVFLVSEPGGSDMVTLTRLALLAPAGLFLVWWMIGPGLTIDAPTEAQAPATDADALAERMRDVEHVFDSAVPAAKRSTRGDDLEWFRASIKRDAPASDGSLSEAWGLPRRDAASRAAERG